MSAPQCLDVVGPDSTTGKQLSDALDAVTIFVPQDETVLKETWEEGSLSVRLSVSPRVPSRSARDEFRQLSRRAVAIWEGPDRNVVTIRQSREGNVHRFALTGAGAGRSDVTISDDTWDDFEKLQGGFYSVLPQLLLTEDELTSLPKIQVVNPSGAVLWERD